MLYNKIKTKYKSLKLLSLDENFLLIRIKMFTQVCTEIKIKYVSAEAMILCQR